MDAFSTLLEHLDQYIFEPVTHQFLGLFDLNGRLGILFLGISLLVAFALFRVNLRTGQTDTRSFWQFLGGSRVHLHRSALLDYRYYLIRAVLKVALVLPVVALVDPYILQSGDYIAFFTNLWGARPQTGENLSLSLLYGLGLFLVYDFKHYWVHRAFHSKWLWEFHKVHHSAPVLVPPTASRIHFVEKIVERIATAVVVGAYAGTFWYACGGEISRYTLFGVTYLTFIFNSLAANLRHSHVWLSFGPRVERFLNSPAQHQIHHSDAQRHFNKNFGTNLSVWDWMFGTLYVTSSTPEPIRFGTGQRDAEHYLTVYSLIVTPFTNLARRLRRPDSPEGSTPGPST
ncbi:hypothetical protein D777_01734 [Marinobacter nitratireducens]|uniref:Fatty acid hydroxylase domain-containing protein n=1 Tax=Marinobacter nitratireducens TaxID=1137280 RepID=A0A072NE64_9GAMM|nr:sterol desaturase family protein [Marinobacter nitratireducens]KEF31385.1 hypothetical protein D777_01734 [Marinobacter nitratireducens]